MNKKKKILAFGVAGEGRGHAARTIALSERLVDYYDIVIFAPSTITDFLSFELPYVQIIEIPAIGLHKENHTINYSKTLVKNFINITSLKPEVKKIAHQMKSLSVDVLVSDFEPFTALAAANLKLPVLHLNHPGIVNRYFSLKPDAIAAKLTARLMMPSGTQNLICSFYGGDIGPIIRSDIKGKTPVKGDYYVVYTKEESREALQEAVNSFPHTQFIFFPDKNLNFTDILAGCRGVISSSGHQMLSEALFLKKPVLAFPQRMQFEQRLNAIMLENSGWGIHGDMNHPENAIRRFIKSIDDFPFRSSLHDKYLFSDCTPEALSCIRNFVESNSLERTTKTFAAFTYRKNRPVKFKPA